MNRPSPRPRPRPAADNTVTSKPAFERLTGVEDKAPARKRGRAAVVTFLDKVWDRAATHPQVGWEFAHECLATPDLLQRLKAQHAAEDAEQVSE